MAGERWGANWRGRGRWTRWRRPQHWFEQKLEQQQYQLEQQLEQLQLGQQQHRLEHQRLEQHQQLEQQGLLFLASMIGAKVRPIKWRFCIFGCPMPRQYTNTCQ